MKKKIIKTIAAIGGVGLVAAGSTTALTSCGENKNLQVHFEQKQVTLIDVNEDSSNFVGNILINVTVVNKIDGTYAAVTDIHEKVLQPDGSEDTTGTIKIEETINDQGIPSIKFIIQKKFAKDENLTGMWSFVIWAKELRAWTTSIEVVKYINN